MSKNRITLVAIVLLLLTGFIVFSFTRNDADEKLEGNENKTEIKKEEEKEEETLTAVEDEVVSEEPVESSVKNTNNDVGEVINQIVETVKSVASGEEDSSYLKALTAVISAENTIDDTSYDAAKELVAKVKDSTKKQSLNERLAEVKNAIDVTALVKNLEEKVSSIATAEDINTSKEYRDSNSIQAKITAVTLKSVKDDLNKRLKAVNKILNDVNAPVLNVEDGKFYNSLTITATDDNEFELILSKDGSEGLTISNNSSVTEEGAYTLKAIDKAFNEVTVAFTIDKTAPVIIGTANNQNYNRDVTYEVTTQDTTQKDFAIEEENMGEVIVNGTSYDSESAPTKFTSDGNYEIKAKDKAGNESETLTFTIDKIPTATFESVYQEDGENSGYLVTMTTSEPISAINNHPTEWHKVNDTTYTRLFVGNKNTLNRVRSLIITDLTGNQSGQLNYELWPFEWPW